MSDTQIGAIFLIVGLVLFIYTIAFKWEAGRPIRLAYFIKGSMLSFLCIVIAVLHFAGLVGDELIENQPPITNKKQTILDSIIAENNDACKAHLYTCLKFALAEELNKSKEELVLFKGCLGDLPVKGSYLICANHLGMIIEEENSFQLKMAVETLILSLDSLQYDSLWLFQPSEPYTVVVSD